MEQIKAIGKVLNEERYLTIFVVSTFIFSFIYIFAWNFILIRDMYFRYDLWTPLNILFLLITAVLSSLVLTLSIFSIKSRAKLKRTKYGTVAILPTLFNTVCPNCGPLLLSMFSGTFAIGMSIVNLGIIIKIITIFILLISLYYISSNLHKCKI